MVGAAIIFGVFRWYDDDDGWFKSIDGIENRYAADVESNGEFRKLGGVLRRPFFKKISSCLPLDCLLFVLVILKK